MLIKKGILFTFCLFTVSILLSQNSKLTSVLESKLQENAQDLIPIRIQMADRVDCFALNLEFKQNNTPVSERPKIVIESLMNKSDETQGAIRELIKENYSHHYVNMKSFWISNMIILEASPELIHVLKSREEIDLIDFEDNKFIPHDEYEVSHDQSIERIEGGIEPGLAAINAPAMWALGYTGRAQLVYDYDTGVWDDHPAFSDRYMGNFYPTEQSWYGYHFDEPSGHINSHGTHTLGTIAGLVEETNDTIGVAFKSYWIANDYVEQTVAELLPITEMVTAFEWALNPDGDINTTHDIPDVISNSWRWYDEEDQLHCEDGFVVDIMNAIEAAGIANIFSGGNFGPNNVSISSPQRINTSEVNTFSVGSVNSTNFNFPFPISNFSSRGPTQCPGEGSLEIHPEVVAPGHNVRSAWKHDEFNTISGTSMATPHVSGAVLLLKEAFPDLSGEDLLWALYLTAVDLGEEGEDNVYGNGLIDVYAAFLYLSESNTPVDPNAVQWDLAISNVLDIPEGRYSCNDSFIPTLELKNLGQNTIEEVMIEYQINDGSFISENFTIDLASDESTEVVLQMMTAEDYGLVELNFITSIVGQDEEYDHYNNRRLIKFNYRSPADLPFQEGFESAFSAHDWFLENDDQYWTWDTIPTAGLDEGSYSASMQYFEYSPRQEQVDGMVTPELYLPADGNTSLKFHRSYPKAQSNVDYRDTLRVLLSTDCGETWPHVVFERFSTALSTMDTLVGDYVPEFNTHWARDSVNLTPFAGQNVLIKFEGVNKKGNNLYIDNINIYNGDVEPVGVVNQILPQLAIGPNPAHNFTHIFNPTYSGEPWSLVVYDFTGKMIDSKQLNQERFILELDQYAAGSYVVELTNEFGSISKKLVVY